MNAERHTHDLVIERRYPYSHTGPLEVTYGDQKHVWPVKGPFLDWRRARRVVRMVRAHDRASIDAGIAVKQLASDRERYAALVTEEAGKAWGAAS